jgi:hypothetical protein
MRGGACYKPPMFAHLARLVAAGLVSLSFIQTSAQQAPSSAERFWPQWRGPYATGVSRTAVPPLEWSDTKNIRWKTEIPGRGSASPIVWGDRVYILTAVPADVPVEASHAPRGAAPSRCFAIASRSCGITPADRS